MLCPFHLNTTYGKLFEILDRDKVELCQYSLALNEGRAQPRILVVSDCKSQIETNESEQVPWFF